MDRRQFILACQTAATAASLLSVASFAQTASAMPANIADPAPGSIRLGLLAVGGMGSACLREMAGNLSGIQCVIAIDTDANTLQAVQADRRIQLGNGSLTSHDQQQITQFAQAAQAEISQAVAGLDMVLLVAGMGGGAGTGIAPVAAQVLRLQGILTLGFAVLPFDFEGPRRQVLAQQGLAALHGQLPALLLAHNNDLLSPLGDATHLDEALCPAPQAVAQLCTSIQRVLRSSQHPVGLDLDELRQWLLQHPGVGAFGYATAPLPGGAQEAANKAMGHPLLGQNRLQQAQSALVTIESQPGTLRLSDVKNIINQLRQQLDPAAALIYSSVSTPLPAGVGVRVSIWAQGLRNTAVG